MMLRRILQAGEQVGLLITAITTTIDVQRLLIRLLSSHMEKTEAIEDLEVEHRVHLNSLMIVSSSPSFSVAVNRCSTSRSLRTQKSRKMRLRVQLQCL
jgi:hypothetical protein